MDPNDFLEQMKEIQTLVLDFIDKENYNEINQFINEKIQANKYKLKSLLYLLLNISNKHHRNASFFQKIETILVFFKDQIINTFSNIEIFNIFASNKRILLILIKQDIIHVDSPIKNHIISKQKEYYPQYFYNEIRPFLSEEEFFLFDIPENYDEMREIGENEQYLCQLIRKDLIKDFIIYVNQNNISLDTEINHSIYETNLYLVGKRPTLLEYSAYFGSIQIINYLLMNKVKVSSHIWNYSIHSHNNELLYLLEEKKYRPQYGSFKTCLKKAIKCHHNDLIDYFIDKIPKENQNIDKNDIENLIFQDLVGTEEIPEAINIQSIISYNFNFIDLNLIDESYLFNLCEYDYFPLVVMLLSKYPNIDLNTKSKNI